MTTPRVRNPQGRHILQNAVENQLAEKGSNGAVLLIVQEMVLGSLGLRRTI